MERAYPIGYGQVHFGWVPIFLLIAFGTQGLVHWLKEPLLQLLLVSLTFLAERVVLRPYAVLDDEQLWVMEEGQEPHPIPLSHVKRISKGIATITVHTADIRHPVLRFNGYATSGLFIRRLQEYLKNRGG